MREPGPLPHRRAARATRHRHAPWSHSRYGPIPLTSFTTVGECHLEQSHRCHFRKGRGRKDDHQCRIRHRAGADRVAQRLPGVPGRRPQGHPLRGQLRRLRLRHRDHPPASERGRKDRRASDTDVLRRRDLPREWPEVRQGRGVDDATKRRAPLRSALSAPLRPGAQRERPLRSEARLREQSQLRPRGGAARRPGGPLSAPPNGCRPPPSRWSAWAGRSPAGPGC